MTTTFSEMKVSGSLPFSRRGDFLKPFQREVLEMYCIPGCGYCQIGDIAIELACEWAGWDVEMGGEA